MIMTQFFVAAGGFIVALAGISAAVGVLAKSQYLGRPFRWLWRTNVSTPAGHWFKRNVGEVVDERINHLMTHNNGGSSLKDLSDAVGIVKGSVEMLLEHDAERDTAGRRYGPEHLQEES